MKYLSYFSLIFIWISVSFGQDLSDRAAYFDANSQANIVLPADTSFQISTHWTLETWVWADTLPNYYQALISKNVSPRPPSLWLLGGFIHVWFDDGGDQIVSAHAIKVDEWTHIAATYDSSYLKIYINGELDTMVAKSIVPMQNNSNWYLGQRGDNQYYFSGALDEVRIWDRALSATEIKYYMQFECAGTENGLIALYHMNETSESGSVSDFSPYGRTGKNSGVYFDSPGAPIEHTQPVNSAWFIRSVCDIKVPDDPSLTISTQWTLECWIKPTEFPKTWQALISKNVSNGESVRPPSLWTYVNRVEVWFSSDSTGDMAQASGHYILKNGIWQHVAATYDSNKITIYVNGHVDTVVTTSVVPNLNQKDWTFGQRGDSSFYYNGYMDEVRIWNRALSQKEILDKMGKSLKGDFPGLMGAWSFNQTQTDTMAYDATSNHNDGKLELTNLVYSDTPVLGQDEFVTAVSENVRQEHPKTFVLYQNYPNPFNPTTTIRFELVRSGYVSLKIYDINGRQVMKVFDGRMSAGTYSLPVSADNLASGLYFYRLESGGLSQTKRMLMIK